jgi:hypothetical protein
MSSSPELTDTAYDILKMLGKDADFLYDTIETYIKDAEKANKSFGRDITNYQNR